MKNILEKKQKQGWKSIGRTVRGIKVLILDNKITVVDVRNSCVLVRQRELDPMKLSSFHLGKYMGYSFSIEGPMVTVVKNAGRTLFKYNWVKGIEALSPVN